MTRARVLADLIGGGAILQVKHTQFTGTNSITLDALTDTAFSDLTVNITPTSTSSTIHLQAHIFGEHGEDNSSAYNHVFFFYRDTTKLGHASAGNRSSGISMATRVFFNEDDATTPEIARYDFFDTPSTTSQITYKVGLRVKVAESFFLNRTADDNDATSDERGVSFISATEIAG
tara:strand:+ start:75 stop:599 length:525 start_codon:yes stop_codon:yes gene_type:complete